jgi:Uma2 family endonuclease
MNILIQSPIRTIADLLHRLGDVPADRVRFKPFPGSATIEDLLKPENELCELVDETLVEKSMGTRESFLAAFLIEVLGPFVRARKLGILLAPDGSLEILSGLVRLPDLAFISWDRLPEGVLPKEPIWSVVPDLAVEILSQSNTRREMERKREEYFQAGVRLVWEIDPRTRTAKVYTELDQCQEFGSSDTISGEPVLPGFSLSLSHLFAELDHPG